MAARSNETTRKPRRRNHPWAIPVGILIFVLTIIGIGSLVKSGVTEVKKLTNDDADKTKYADFLTPVVMFDPDPFDDIKNANGNQLLESSIWALLKNDKDPHKYESDDGWLTVPVKDVNKEFARLYGSDIKPSHKTIEGYGYEFQYDDVNKAYLVPLTGVEPIYTPKVLKISQKGDSTILYVGYIANSEWTQDKNGNAVAPKPAKYVSITLRGKAGSQHVSAVQLAEKPIVATTSKKK